MYDFYFDDQEQMYVIFDTESTDKVYLAETHDEANDICFQYNNA